MLTYLASYMELIYSNLEYHCLFFQSEYLLMSLIYSKLNGICTHNANVLINMLCFPQIKFSSGMMKLI